MTGDAARTPFPLTSVLGRGCVLDAAADARRRAVVVHDGEVVGLAAYERLYGPQAEFAVSLRVPEQHILVNRLIADLARAARADGIATLRAEILAMQRLVARTVRAGRLVGGALRVDTTEAVAAGYER